MIFLAQKGDDDYSEQASACPEVTGVSRPSLLPPWGGSDREFIHWGQNRVGSALGFLDEKIPKSEGTVFLSRTCCLSTLTLVPCLNNKIKMKHNNSHCTLPSKQGIIAPAMWHLTQYSVGRTTLCWIDNMPNIQPALLDRGERRRWGGRKMEERPLQKWLSNPKYYCWNLRRKWLLNIQTFQYSLKKEWLFWFFHLL